MNGVRKLLARRVVRAIAVGVASLAMVLGFTGQANAAIYWYNIQMVVQGDQVCLGGASPGNTDVELHYAPIRVPGCMARGTDQIWLVSMNPDTYGHANVWIYVGGACLEAQPASWGHPNSIAGSVWLTWEVCDITHQGQIWSMVTAAPAQNVGNPLGLKHFINFYNGTRDVCLDGGYGVYGFPGFCSTTNNWQIWNIYTNAGPSDFNPYYTP